VINFNFSKVFAVFTFYVLSIYAQAQHSQSMLMYKDFNRANGFDANEVSAFHEDSLGFMWVGTENGLFRYDGNEMMLVLNSIQIKDSMEIQLDISAIHEDEKGIFWLGIKRNPDVGLLKFDPMTMKYKPFNIYPDSIPIQKRWINSIYEDENRILWMPTDAGALILFDIKNEILSAIIHPDESELSFLEKYNIKPNVYFDFLQVLPDPRRKDIWVTTIYGLFLFDPDERSFQVFIPEQVQIHDSQIVTFAVFDSSGILWVTFSGWLYRFNTESKKFESAFKNLKDYDLGYDNYVRAFINPTYNEQLVLTSNKGIIIMNIKNYNFQMILDKTDPRKSLQVVSGTGFDSYGNLWLGSLNEGITIVSNLGNPFKAIWEISNKGFFDSVGYMLRCIDISADNKLWIGGGYFLRAFDIEKEMLGPEKYFRIPQCFNNNFGEDGIHYLRCDPNGQELWISSWGTCFQKFNPQIGYFHLINPYPQGKPLAIQGLEWDSLGYAWGGGFMGIVRIDPKTGQYVHFELDSIFLKHKDKMGDFEYSSDGFIYSVLMTSSRDILFQSRNNLYKLKIIEDKNPEDIYIEKYRFCEVIPRNLIEGKIGPDKGYLNKSMIDNFDQIWFGIGENGLFHYDPESKSITNYTIEEGLAENRINTIIMDDQNRVWIGCYDGLSCLIPETGEIYNFFESDGLVSSSFRVINFPYEGQSQKDNSGNIYLGSSRGVIYFDPDDVIKSMRRPSVVLSSLIINNEQIQPIENGIINKSISYFPDIYLNHKDRQVSVQYAVPDFTQNYQRISYQHKLEGFDDQWIDEGKRTRLTYSHIPPGRYQLKINASNTNNFVEEDAVLLNIFMAPAPWATWWAYVGYIIIIGGIFYLIIYLVIRRNIVRRKLEMEHVELEKIKELEEAKTRFFTHISHEIRTPLSLILQPVETLYKGEAQGVENKFYGIIRRNALRLNELLNQILDFSRLESGKVRLKVRNLDIVEYVRLMTGNFESLIESQGLKVALDISVHEKLLVYLDTDKFEKVINNLLSNAIKFTEEGQITIRIERRDKKDGFRTQNHNIDSIVHLKDKDLVVISIKDTGIGMTEEQQNMIFDRFYRAQENQKYSGIGIGLSLTKELVDLHKGAIWVESEPGQGSTFYVILQLEKSQFSDVEIQISDEEDETRHAMDALSDFTFNEDRQHSSLDTTKPTILFIEDNEDMRKFVKHYFEDEYIFHEAQDGKEGYDKAIEIVPDIVISDIMMPKIDGLELCRRLKDDQRTRHIPIILLTAKADKDSKIKGLGTGADDYISKPFDKDELLIKVKNQIDLMDKLRDKFKQEFFLKDKKGKTKSRDGLFLTNIVDVIMERMDDSEFNVEELSHEVGLSRSQLFRKLKVLTGLTPQEFIRSIRMKQAAELLIKKAGNISEIAYTVGFDNLPYFTKCFTHIYHVSPSKYAEKKLQKKS